MNDSFFVLGVWQLSVLGASLATIVFAGWIAATVARSDISPKHPSWWTGGSALGLTLTIALAVSACIVVDLWVGVIRSSGHYRNYGLFHMGDVGYAHAFTHNLLALLGAYVVVRYALGIRALA